MRQISSLGLALLFLSATAGAAVAIPEAVEPKFGCLKYGDPSVSLTGVTFTRIYFGPPGYGEHPERDGRDTALLLLLDAPVCVQAPAHPEEDNNSYDGDVIVVQLSAVHIDTKMLWKMQGRRISVKGSLYHALTGHHRTPVLMDVYSLDPIAP